MRNLIWFSLLLFTACQSDEEADMATEKYPTRVGVEAFSYCLQSRKKEF